MSADRPDLPALTALAREALERALVCAPAPWSIEVWYGSVSGGWAATGPLHEAAEGEDDEPGSPACQRAEKDAAFISAARTDVPALASGVLALAEENDRLRALCGKAADFCDATMRRVSEGDGTQHMTFFFPPGHAETELGARLRAAAEGNPAP